MSKHRKSLEKGNIDADLVELQEGCDRSASRTTKARSGSAGVVVTACV